jgi:hypothetical protein
LSKRHTDDERAVFDLRRFNLPPTNAPKALAPDQRRSVVVWIGVRGDRWRLKPQGAEMLLRTGKVALREIMRGSWTDPVQLVQLIERAGLFYEVVGRGGASSRQTFARAAEGVQ